MRTPLAQTRHDGASAGRAIPAVSSAAVGATAYVEESNRASAMLNEHAAAESRVVTEGSQATCFGCSHSSLDVGALIRTRITHLNGGVDLVDYCLDCLQTAQSFCDSDVPIFRRVERADAKAQRAADKNEIAVAFDVAQRALNATAPLSDQNGIAFAIGRDVRSLTELWCSSPRRTVAGPFMMIAGTRGVITKVDERIVAVMFEGRSEPYLIRADRARATIEVVA